MSHEIDDIIPILEDENIWDDSITIESYEDFQKKMNLLMAYEPRA